MALFDLFRAKHQVVADPFPRDLTREAEQLINQGNASEDEGNLDAALCLYDRAIACAPNLARGYLNRGNAMLQRGDRPGAIRAYREAIQRQPDHAGAHFNLGNALYAAGQVEEALLALRQALTIQPRFSDAQVALGNIYDDLGRLDDAIDSYGQALVSSPGSADALTNLGLALCRAKRYNDATQRFQQAIDLQPDRPYAVGNLVSSRLYACDWCTYEQDIDTVLGAIERGVRAISPFQLIPIATSPAAQLHCGTLYTLDKYPARPPLWRGERYRHQRIRVAYLSADYHNHATAVLMARLFELHDRECFEVHAISFGWDDCSAMRQRLLGAFEHFIDVRERSDGEVAELLHRLEIDIAVDLKGYTLNARPGILARRPAPVQVSYLGFPGTLGADYIDYIIADRVVIPAEDLAHYREQIVWLPDCYQANDGTRHIPRNVPTRAAAGLPENAFVFCSFNNSYKISPDLFAVWMRVLEACPNSVLWLLRDNEDAVCNLRREAQRAGVDAERLVFAPRLDLDAHLNRHPLADLFLDTAPCNAHTTASDALWAGLPVLTCRNGTFAGRVASSLLCAVDLPDLITDTPGAYEKAAIELFHRRDRLAEFRQHLIHQREKLRLFDTDALRRHLETAYHEMWRRTEAFEAATLLAVGQVGAT